MVSDAADGLGRTVSGRRGGSGGGRPVEGADRGPSGGRVGCFAMTQWLDLVPIWTAILAVGVFLYVALDGFDLGGGIPYSFPPTRAVRKIAMDSIPPVWDRTETVLSPRLGRLFPP